MPALPFEYVGGLQAFLHFYYFFIAHQLSYITHSNSGEGLLFYGDVTIVKKLDEYFNELRKIFYESK